MKQGFRVIDSELHLMEPFDLWERGLAEPFRSWTKIIPPPDGHLAPSGTRFAIGRDATLPPDNTSVVLKQALRRWPDDHHMVKASTQCSPEVFVEGLDIEGIDVAILTPTLGIAVTTRDDLEPEHALALCRVYNDYAAEFCRANPARFKFWGWLPRQEPALAAEEARRCVTELGAVGIAMFQGATNGHLLTEEVFTPLWQELNRLRAPLGFHIGTGGRLRDDQGTRYRGRRRADLIRNTVAQSWAPTTLAELIMGGVLEEHPDLRIAIMESNASWLPWLLWRMDDKWERYGPDQDFTLSLKPSEYFRRQCYAVVDADEGVVRHVIEDIGDDNLLFSTDYPHHDSPFPDGVNTFLALQGIGAESKRKILWDNGARLYGLEVPANAPAAAR